jgi:hypothetical protein
MKQIFLGLALMGAMATHPVAALAAGSTTELHAGQVRGVRLTKQFATVWNFTATYTGQMLFTANGVDAPAGGAATYYVLQVDDTSYQGWSYGGVSFAAVINVSAGQIVKVVGKYTGGTGATVTAANFSAIIAPR